MHSHCLHRSCCAEEDPLIVKGVPRSAPPVSRRGFLYGTGAVALAGVASRYLHGAETPPFTPVRLPIRVQPVLTYSVPQRREATSWREWGGIQTEAQAGEERNRIEAELARIRQKADFPMEFLPLVSVRTLEQAAAVPAGEYDALVIYAAGGNGRLLEAMTKPDRWNLMFLRHDSGPVYLWYEIVHPRFLRKTVDEYGQPGMDPHDVVVDEPDGILWRLRGLSGLKNTVGKRIVAGGGAGGGGAGGRKAPEIAREIWKLDLRDYPYSELGPRIRKTRQDTALVSRCREQAAQYLRDSGTTLETTRTFVENAFVLTQVLKDVMREAGTDAITINSCMGTIMPMAETTACLPLSLLNDEGYLAFCESDFVVIPSGILLHYISGKPVFLNDPTYPHGGVVTLAHCTAPRKMDGARAENARILTHFESDYGAAPKVEMKIGQRVTNLVPDFACRKWVGFDGTIIGNPFLEICRSQIDVRIEGDSDKLMEEMKGFHWMTCYGSHLPESGYALGKVGVELLKV